MRRAQATGWSRDEVHSAPRHRVTGRIPRRRRRPRMFYAPCRRDAMREAVPRAAGALRSSYRVAGSPISAPVPPQASSRLHLRARYVSRDPRVAASASPPCRHADTRSTKKTVSFPSSRASASASQRGDSCVISSMGLQPGRALAQGLRRHSDPTRRGAALQSPFAIRRATRTVLFLFLLKSDRLFPFAGRARRSDERHRDGLSRATPSPRCFRGSLPNTGYAIGRAPLVEPPSPDGTDDLRCFRTSVCIPVHGQHSVNLTRPPPRASTRRAPIAECARLSLLSAACCRTSSSG